MATNENDMIEIGKTWSKVSRNLRQVGLGDGLSNGRDSNFQNDFDRGFYEGFRNGYNIGQLKGAIFAKNSQQQKDLCENILLSEPKSAWCQICSDKRLLEKSIADITAYQTEICKKNFEVLNCSLK